MEEVTYGAAEEISAAESERRHFDRVLALALGVGVGLLSCGASVLRVEITVERICTACGAKEVNVMALPSIVMCSIKLADGSEVSQLKRSYEAGNNFRKIEMFNQLSRDISAGKVAFEEAEDRLEEINKSKGYPLPVAVIAGGLVAGIFTVYFGGSIIDGIPSFIIGCAMLYVSRLLSRRDFNAYARTFVLSLMGGVFSVLFSRLLILCGAQCSLSMVSIGTIMVVVPGLLICNAVRDMFAGDIYSGAFELMNGVLTIVAIAAGYSSALVILRPVLVDLEPIQRGTVADYIYRILTCLGGACSVGVMFNCNLKRIAVNIGNILATFVIYLVLEYFFAENYFLQFLVATLFAASVSEVLARVVKAPSTIFLVPAIIVLVPGGSLYYTVSYLVNSEYALASDYGMRALLSLLGIGVGISVVSVLCQISRPQKGKAAIQRFLHHKNKIKQGKNDES